MSKATITFHGAAGRVTGSCSLVEMSGKKVLVDCGLIQGDEKAAELNREPFPFAVDQLDAVVLTHGHLDHTGRLPRLVAAGYKGPIYAHPATGELAELVWRDSARLSAKYDGGPLYDDAMVDRTLQLIEPLRYDQKGRLGDVHLRFFDAGHILGSSHALLGGDSKNILFSGDVGAVDTPIIRDPTFDWPDVDRLDAVVVESTYGNRLHKNRDDTVAEFKSLVLEAVKHKGFILIPAFAIGRTQEMLYHFNALVGSGRMPRVPVLLDAPMAEKVTAIYRNHRECYDEDAWGLIERGDPPLRFEGLRELVSSQESKSVQAMAAPAIVIAGSGMCTGGRILHHLKNFLDRSSTTVIFVGWQGYGTLGRRLVDGAKKIRIHGQETQVQARIVTMNGFSAHADRDGLLAWARKLPGPPSKWLINHGEPESAQGLAEALRAASMNGVHVVAEDQSFEI